MKRCLSLSILILISLSIFSCRIDLDKNSREKNKDKKENNAFFGINLNKFFGDGGGQFSGERGDKNVIKKVFEIADYQKIKLSGICNVIYQQKENESPYLAIKTDSNLMEYVKVEVDGDELKVSLDKPNSSPSKFEVYTNSKELVEVNLSGAGSFKALEKVTVNDLKLSLSGTGSANFKDIEAESIECRLSGAGSLNLAGSGNYLRCNLSGVGSIKAEDFVVKDAKCSVSGVGSVYVQVENKLDAKVSGVGSVKYKKEPKEVIKSRSGIGSIKKM